jgi:malonyl-CoA O-methyltransferase
MRQSQSSFDRAADTFDSADYVLAATRDGLLVRLEPVAIEAAVVIDLGSATGSAGRTLRQRFRRARVIAVDLSRPMLEKARLKKAWLSKSGYVQAEAAALPFADHSVDVIFANLLLPWIQQTDAVFAEVSRVLRKDGLFVFSTLGRRAGQGRAA